MEARILEQAQTALKRGDLDGAAELLLKLLAQNPGEAEARRYLRATALRRQELGGGTPGAVGGFLNTALCKGLAVVLPTSAIRRCDRHLARDPNRVAVRETLAGILAKRGYDDAAICEYEAARDVDPQRKEVLRALGRLYKAEEEIGKALQLYEELRRIDPHDVEANRETQQLAAQGAIIKGGWEESTGYRDVIKDSEEAERLEEERAVSRAAADVEGTIARQEQTIEREPNISSHRIRLGDLLRQAHRYDEAEQAYLKAKEINPTGWDAVERLGDLKTERIQQQIDEVKAELQAKPNDPALTSKLEGLNEQRLEVGIADLTERVKAHPTDMNLRTRLGVLFYEAGQYDKAIAEFQQAQNDPRHMFRASSYMGLCFMKKKMYDLAVRRFEQALARVEGFTEWSKELLYNLGAAYDEMGNKAEAKAQYEKIYERDITYKDVAQRLEALYKDVPSSGASGSGGM